MVRHAISTSTHTPLWSVACPTERVISGYVSQLVGRITQPTQRPLLGVWTQAGAAGCTKCMFFSCCIYFLLELLNSTSPFLSIRFPSSPLAPFSTSASISTSGNTTPRSSVMKASERWLIS